MEKRDALGFPPKHKELMRFIVDLLNSKAGPPVDRLGLYEVIHRNHIGPDHMWNFDEKGFMMGRGEEK